MSTQYIKNKKNIFLIALPFINTDPQKSKIINFFKKHRICDIIDIFPPINENLKKFLLKYEYGVMPFLLADKEKISSLKECLPNNEPWTEIKSEMIPSMEFIESELDKLRFLTKKLGNKIWWNVMPEFDSSGLQFWSEIYKIEKGMKQGFRNRKEAYQRLKEFIFSHELLKKYFNQSPQERGFNILAICGFVFSCHYAYKWGNDLVLLERSNEDISDIQVGIAFIRGAGKQYNKPWGIDTSTWRVDMSTIYDEKVKKVIGWSLDYLKRHWYIAYLSGANMLRHELFAGQIFFETKNNTPKLNPIGIEVKKFAEFVKRYPDRGKTYTPVAFLLDFHHGWDTSPKKGDFVWYEQIPFEDGDYMLDNFFSIAFPCHEHLQIDLRVPWSTTEEYVNFIKNEGDPRSYEPMPSSRWGDCFDVILSDVFLETLKQYKAVIVLGKIEINEELFKKLEIYVRAGGIVVINVKQIKGIHRKFLGVKLSNQVRWAKESKCLICKKDFTNECKYNYQVVKPKGAKVKAETLNGYSLITENKIGKGKVILTTPFYLQNVSHNRFLDIAIDMFDHLMEQFALVKIEGERIEYFINKIKNGLLIVLLNNRGYEWNGKIIIKQKINKMKAREILNNHKNIKYFKSDNQWIIEGNVDRYGMCIYSVCYGDN